MTISIQIAHDRPTMVPVKVRRPLWQEFIAY